MTVGVLICVLEPDPLTLRLTGEALESEGFSVLLLSDAAGALSTIKEQRPDLLVLEPRVEPPGAGWTLLETIKTDDHLRELPTIVCTSDVAGVQKRSELLSRPPETSVLIKPFDRQALIAKIRAVLQGERSGSEPHEPRDVVD
jgi:DNA-binding response OmpR family regulator